MDFTVQRDPFAFKCNQIINAHGIENTERHIRYKGENEKYNIVLIIRRHKDELMRMKRENKDNQLINVAYIAGRCSGM
jgi:hypothetical protein